MLVCSGCVAWVFLACPTKHWVALRGPCGLCVTPQCHCSVSWHKWVIFSDKNDLLTMTHEIEIALVANQWPTVTKTSMLQHISLHCSTSKFEQNLCRCVHSEESGCTLCGKVFQVSWGPHDKNSKKSATINHIDNNNNGSNGNSHHKCNNKESEDNIDNDKFVVSEGNNKHSAMKTTTMIVGWQQQQ